jgi:Universal stress protein family
MTGDERPVLVAYDGSAESRAAVRSAVTLFPGRRLIVVTVWEPGLAMALASLSAGAPRGFSAEVTAETARVERDQAATRPAPAPSSRANWVQRRNRSL